ncbi:MAG: hypothetical protein HY321_05655 [Armatimonadetes bacterium]|nr:hypothetical protein [Armatimonadota bacterium]
MATARWERALLLALAAAIVVLGLHLMVGRVTSPPRDGRPRAALHVLKDLRLAQESYRYRHGQYAGLTALADAGLTPLREGGTHPVSGYRFHCWARGEEYVIVAVPPRDLRGSGGPVFVLDETGGILDAR